MDRAGWWATVHEVTKNQTQLKQLSTQHTLNVIIVRVIYIFSWFGDNFKNTIFVVGGGGGQAKWLAGSYFPNQGQNLCPQQ